MECNVCSQNVKSKKMAIHLIRHLKTLGYKKTREKIIQRLKEKKINVGGN